MRKRGRRSADEISTPKVVSLPQARRPDPPGELTAEQAEIWREIAEALPADWFGRESWPLLEQFCRHTDQANRLAEMIQARAGHIADGRPGALEGYLSLLQAQRRETAAIKSIAVALRLSPSSKVRPETAGWKRDQHAPGPRPWED